MNKEEKAPHGLDQHEPGAKADSGKPHVALMMSGFAKALEEVAKVTTFGAAKYSPNGWRHVANAIERYDDAGARHKLKRFAGEAVDPDSGLLHAAHEAWNCLAVLEFLLKGEAAPEATVRCLSCGRLQPGRGRMLNRCESCRDLMAPSPPEPAREELKAKSGGEDE